MRTSAGCVGVIAVAHGGSCVAGGVWGGLWGMCPEFYTAGPTSQGRCSSSSGRGVKPDVARKCMTFHAMVLGHGVANAGTTHCNKIFPGRLLSPWPQPARAF